MGFGGKDNNTRFIDEKGDGWSVARNGDWTIKPWAMQEYFKLASGVTNDYVVDTIHQKQ